MLWAYLIIKEGQMRKRDANEGIKDGNDQDIIIKSQSTSQSTLHQNSNAVVQSKDLFSNCALRKKQLFMTKQIYFSNKVHHCSICPNNSCILYFVFPGTKLRPYWNVPDPTWTIYKW